MLSEPKYYVDSLRIHPFSLAGICSPTYSPNAADIICWILPLAASRCLPCCPHTSMDTFLKVPNTLEGECAIISGVITQINSGLA